MRTIQESCDRITFSLPRSMNLALENLKNEVKRSKSDIIKSAIESYIEQQEKIKLKKAIELMANEYENNSQLTALTQLDSEEFL